MEKCSIGLIGMEVMGRSLVLNMESRGYSVAVYNRTGEKTRAFADGAARGKSIHPTYELKEFVGALERPRKIMLMVKEGAPVDAFVESLLPLLEKGDLIIDGGNSFFKDTMRRNEMLGGKGILFIGTGVSGGEEGALKGPAIMPGGQREAYGLVEKLFRDIAAKAYDGEPCVDYVGPHGAGHFVKTTHNGIEYGDMELIGEVVWFFRNIGMGAREVADIMAAWNGPDDILRSYLIEITADSMTQPHAGGGDLVDRVADITRMKGTGTWTVQSAMELLVPIPTIAAAVFSREMSQDKDLRLAMAPAMKPPAERFTGDRKEVVALAHDALYIAKISSYAQGMALLDAASRTYRFELNLGRIARLWRAGCIIRAQFLDEITKAYTGNPALPNLLAAPAFSGFVGKNIGKLAQFIGIAHAAGVPALAMTSAYDYILQLVSPVMVSAQVAALQRDYFGAHGYFKIGGPRAPELAKSADGKVREFHTDWLLEGRPEKEITK